MGRRVLLMIDDAQIGGGQQHLLLLAGRMQGFEPHVACGGSGFLVEKLKEAGTPVHPIGLSNRPSIGSFQRCKEILRTVDPVVVHTHGGTAGFNGRLASIGTSGVRRVHTYHGLHYLHDRNSVRNRAFRIVDRTLLNVTHRIICVAASDMAIGTRHGVVDPDKTVLIRNGIDLKSFPRTGEKKRGNPIVIGTVGRLHVQKGHKVLLNAVRRVVELEGRVLVRIVGDGELRAELEAEVGSLGISDLVEFCGSSMDVPAELDRMDIFVLPSLWEGLPLALLEAMAAGLPVVASGVDGILEVATDGQDALLVPPSNPKLLADGILRLVRDTALARRLGENARSRVMKDFSVDTMVRKTEAVYRELLEGKP